MSILDRIMQETAEHEAALEKRLVELVEERKDVKRTLRALARYRKQLGAPPPGLAGLDEPERPLIDAIEAAGNGQPDEADEFGREMAEPVEQPYEPDQEDPLGHPLDQAPEVTEEATPKRRRRSKADA